MCCFVQNHTTILTYTPYSSQGKFSQGRWETFHISIVLNSRLRVAQSSAQGKNRKVRKFVLYLLFNQNPSFSYLHLRCRDYGESMSVIRSSDIGNYLYCHRAWWYKKQGFESENQAELALGTEIHRKHGRQVLASNLMRTLGLVLIFVAMILLVAYCTMQIL